MRHALTFCCLLLLAAPARAQDVFALVDGGNSAQALAQAQSLSDPLLEAYALWASLRDPEASTPIPFNDGYRFLAGHPGWPEEKLIRLRTEEAALDGAGIDKSTLRQFCNAFPPISGRGMFACAAASASTLAQRKQWVKQGWQQGDFSEYEEKNLLDIYGKQLATADHIARMDRLLFEKKTGQAKRMLKRVPRERETLYLARIALSTDARDAASRLNSVPVNVKRDPGLTFDRIGWRMRKGDDDGVRELLLAGPKNPPYAELWWKLRAPAARTALMDGKYSDAIRILEDRGDLKGEALADALFLKGWIALTYRKDTRASYRDFYKLYTSVTTPVSKARAAYWAAESARFNGNPDIMRQWLEKAAARPITFYGQLAFARLHPNTKLPLPPEPTVSRAEETAFAGDEQVKLIKRLAEANQDEMVNRFLLNLAGQEQPPARFVLLTRLAREIGNEANAVRVAKLALRKGVVLTSAGWPVIDVPDDSAIEPALALAIIRQESEFDTQAESPAGARGLMQLMPGTAREVARKNDIEYSKGDLVEPDANMALGTSYLGDMIQWMDGSYILGIAAYNAGPGNVQKWAKAFGRPGEQPEEAVNWIENIPFGETRNYVMRVLENMQIYRQLLDEKSHPQLAQDLTR